MLCEAMLQNIIKGMAAIGSNTCRRMAPAAAENAKPENPLTKPPRKTAVESIASSTGACIRGPQEVKQLAAARGGLASSERDERLGVRLIFSWRFLGDFLEAAAARRFIARVKPPAGNAAVATRDNSEPCAIPS